MPELIKEVDEIKQNLEADLKANLEVAKEELEEFGKDVAYYKKYFWYFPCYILAYIFVERIMPVSQYHVLHCAVDDVIPFCEFFVIPYIGWVAATFLLAFYTFKYDKNSFEKLIRYFIFCTIIVFAAFILYPSAQALRPQTFERSNVCTWLTSMIYFFDTPTNTCPSMHVIGCMGLLFAGWKVKKFDNPLAHVLLSIGAVLIILSTLFLKQHSFIDIIASVPVCVIGWWLCFKSHDDVRKMEQKAASRLQLLKEKC